ncbi:MAG: DUF4932 domain-containing protein [Bacteroidota bacterium]
MKKLLKYLLIPIGILVILAIVYFINPNYFNNLMVDLLYPTVTIEEQHQNKVSVEIPTVYELMYIACVLTKTFQQDDNLISQRTPEYYAEVLQHFEPYKDHPLVQILETQLKEDPYAQIQPSIRLFSLNYDLSTENQLLENKVFHVNKLLLTLFKKKIFYFPDRILVIEDFAAKTNFHQFYTDHLSYYNHLIEKYKQLCDPEGMWQWMEQRFPERYTSYRIIFSPLTGGFHNTIPQLKDTETGDQQTWLFVSPPSSVDLDTLSAKQLELLTSKMTREVFTEIDHNYVNPISDKYMKEIEVSMPDYKKWNRQERGYQSSYATFNEYMTWGLFHLYAKETYSSNQLDSIVTFQSNFMEDSRKFVGFKAFSKQLVTLYEKQKNTTGILEIEPLYTPMLNWMKGYSFEDN